MENQLQRRNDLIPNLVETVKGIAQQEKDVFGQIADSRAKLAGATTPEQRMQAANEQSTALARLLVVVENYPELKSNATFNRLMDELAGTENRIAVERMRYNERVQEYNTSRRRFPSNVTAGIFGFKEHPLFNAPPEAERVPQRQLREQAVLDATPADATRRCAAARVRPRDEHHAQAARARAGRSIRLEAACEVVCRSGSWRSTSRRSRCGAR